MDEFEELKAKVKEVLADKSKRILAAAVIVLLLLVIAMAGCVTVEAKAKPVLMANSPDGAVTIELYGAPCTNETARQIMEMVAATAPIPVSNDWKEVIWIGHKDKKNFAGCWVEIPEREAILFVFEDGDVKLFRRSDFQTPTNAVIERYIRQNNMIRI